MGVSLGLIRDYSSLFGSVMFRNNSGDSMPVVYLTFLHDMINVPENINNWGRAYPSCTLTFTDHVSNQHNV
jgi:hypothetical protein